MVTDLLRSPGVPLLLKEDPDFRNRPRMRPGQIDFLRPSVPMMFGDWRTTESNLAALSLRSARCRPIFGGVWPLSAVGWAITPDAIEALHKYASFDIPLEDAVEAEATAMLIVR